MRSGKDVCYRWVHGSALREHGDGVCDSMTFENTLGATEYAMTFWWSHQGSWGDFQYHTVADTEIDDFYYDTGLYRDVAAVADGRLG